MLNFWLGVQDSDSAVAKCGAHFVNMDSNSVLFVPQGWICCEKSVEGGLLYGVRKSYLTTHSVGAANYRATIDVLKRSNREVGRMEEIATLLTA